MPGLRMPWYVPMIPDADIVALSGSVSNHWSRKSAALIVMSWTNTACWRSGSCWKRARQAGERASAGAGPSRSGRGGTMPRIGLMKRAISTMSWPYSSYASASSLRPAPELADRPAVVVDPPQVVAAAGLRALALAQRRERAVERQDVEAVLRAARGRG